MRRVKGLVVVAVVAMAMVLGGGAALAADVAGDQGQANRRENCSNTIRRQNDDGVRVGGGPKEPFDQAPSNCDGFFTQDFGVIGNQ